MRNRRDSEESLRLQTWMVNNWELWLRVLRLEGELTQEEFWRLGNEFFEKGLHCANLVLITNYWRWAEPVALKNLKKIQELIQEEFDKRADEQD